MIRVLDFGVGDTAKIGESRKGSDGKIKRVASLPELRS
jgi:hypothetical protein